MSAPRTEWIAGADRLGGDGTALAEYLAAHPDFAPVAEAERALLEAERAYDRRRFDPGEGPRLAAAAAGARAVMLRRWDEHMVALGWHPHPHPLEALRESRWRPDLHPRARGGRFRRTFRGALGDAERRGGRVEPVAAGTQFAAKGPRGELAVRATRAGAERSLAAMVGGEARPGSPAHPGRPREPFRDYPTEPFRGDPWLVARARSRVLSGAATTRDEFSAPGPDGRRVYAPERAALHRRIVERLVGTHERRERPALFLTGGGFASGKGGVVDGYGDHPPHRWKPDDAVTVDPDKAKALLPEFAELTRDGDPEANLRVYEEAWDVSQELAAEVRRRRYNVVVDGVGDNTVGEVTARLAEWRAAGYAPPRAVYVGTSTEAALTAARKRMEKAGRTGKLESLRYIPDDVMRDVHRHVSRVFPGVLDAWPADGALELYDTNTWNEARKEWDPSRLILRKEGGRVEVLDPVAYGRFLAKGRERIRPPARAPLPDVGPAALRDDADAGMAEQEAESRDPRNWTPPPGVTYSPEVARIASPADAEDYLRGLGVDGVALTPPGDERGRRLASDADFFRQIAQAVTDAQDRYPALADRKNPRRLRAVRFLSQTPDHPAYFDDPAKTEGLWGTTGQMVGLGGKTWDGHESELRPDAPTGIVLNDRMEPGFQTRHEAPAEDGQASPADATPYGRMTHELGHAVYDAAGRFLADLRAVDDRRDPPIIGDFEQAGLTPQTMFALSEYGASSPWEAWAEAFTTLNVPGALEKVRARSASAARAVERLRDVTRRRGEAVL